MFTKASFLQALRKIRRKTFKSRTIKSAFAKSGIIPHNPAIVLKAIKLIDLGRAVGDKEMGGRIYNYNPTTLSTAIRVPASNEYKSREIEPKATIWDYETGDSQSPVSSMSSSTDTLVLLLITKSYNPITSVIS